MKNKTLRNISFLVGSAFLFTGCGNEKSNNSSDTTLTAGTSTCPTTVLSTTTNLSTTTVHPVTTTLTTSTTPIMTSTSLATTYTNSNVITVSSDVYTTCTITDTDSEVLEYFSEIGKSVRDNFDSEELLDKGKSYFIYCVDFLFYDGEIKGIKFDDLTDGAKEQLLRDISSIDSLICTKYPNYKEDIKEGYGKSYNKASEIIRDGSNNIKDFSKDKLGEENYNKIKEYKDLFVDITSDDWNEFVGILGKGKQKAEDWYNDFKNKRTD